MFKGLIIDYNRDIFQEIIIDYNLLFCRNFVKSKLYLNYILWVIIFVSIRKSLKERSLEHFGSSEHKVLPRSKSFIDPFI